MFCFDIIAINIKFLLFKYINSNPINSNNSNNSINIDNQEKLIVNKKCYIPIDNSNIKIVHMIMTRFLMDLHNKKEFVELVKTKEYILNGIRVMKNICFILWKIKVVKISYQLYYWVIKLISLILNLC